MVERNVYGLLLPGQAHGKACEAMVPPPSPPHPDRGQLWIQGFFEKVGSYLLTSFKDIQTVLEPCLLNASAVLVRANEKDLMAGVQHVTNTLSKCISHRCIFNSVRFSFYICGHWNGNKMTR
ncbi:hypothetical protein AMECASPLE_035998 [Ameca splendens]|uniref:Uncharacterized protein n=1 Tax=Ameca splendens TaxID=208324 RepID=A0ABV0YVI7_9TELE